MSIIYERYMVESILGPKWYTRRHVGSYHTPACWASREVVDLERARFLQDHPNACPDCLGWSVAPSVQYDFETGAYEQDTCETCFDRDACPVCNQGDMDESGWEYCKDCGWNFFAGPHAPIEFECWDCKGVGI